MPAIIPFSGPIPELPDKIKKSNLEFPEAGVRFANGYRFLSDTGVYELKAQKRFQFNMDESDASEDITQLRTYLGGFSMQFTGITGTGAGGNAFRLKNGGSGGVDQYKGIHHDGTTDFTVIFSPALEFTDGLHINWNPGSGGAGSINLWGWTETD